MSKNAGSNRPIEILVVVVAGTVLLAPLGYLLDPFGVGNRVEPQGLTFIAYLAASLWFLFFGALFGKWYTRMDHKDWEEFGMELIPYGIAALFVGTLMTLVWNALLTEPGFNFWASFWGIYFVTFVLYGRHCQKIKFLDDLTEFPDDAVLCRS